jgi:type IV pilus assembly protein PilC
MAWDMATKKFFFRGLSTLQNSGVHILDGLQSLTEQSDDPLFTRTVESLSRKLASGYPLHKALESEGDHFSRLEVALVRVAENSGKLHSVLSRLADLSESQDKLRRELVSALIYPAFVLVLCTGLLIFAPVLVFSDLLDLLRELGTELPLPTRIYLGFSDLVLNPLFVLGCLAILVVGAVQIRKVTQDPGRRRVLERLGYSIPGLSSVLKASAASECSEALAICYQAGVPILAGLRLSGSASFSYLLQDSFKVAEEQLKNGATLTEALRPCQVFDSLSLALLSTAEESGSVSESLFAIAEQCRGRTKDALDTFQKLLEPCLLLFMGLIVGFIAVATLAPTLNLVRAL